MLRADLTANTSIATNIDSMRDGAVLMVAGPWGDQLVFWRVDGEQWFAFDPDAERGQLFWQPGPVAAETVKLLLAELGSAGTPPFSACPSGTGPATRSC